MNNIAEKQEFPGRSLLRQSVALSGLAMLLTMTVYEVAKQLLNPKITIWESHILTIAVSTAIATTVAYFVRRHLSKQHAELERTIRLKEAIEVEQTRIHGELLKSMQQVRQLRGLLPICAHCKKIRDDEGFWSNVEEYVSVHTDASFSHGICPECMEKYYSEYDDDQDDLDE